MPTDTTAPLGSGSASVWEAGWHRWANRVPSPNFGPRPAQAVVDLAVIHSISLPPGQYGTGAVQALFTNVLDWDAHAYYTGIRGLKVSSHFYIERNGTLWQFVSCDARAWHAGHSHYRGRDNCNDDSVGIELEGLEGLEFEPVQYQRLAQLLNDLCARFPLAHVAGHEHIAPGRKADPGPGFDWAFLRHLSRLPNCAFAQI